MLVRQLTVVYPSNSVDGCAYYTFCTLLQYCILLSSHLLNSKCAANFFAGYLALLQASLRLAVCQVVWQ